jgi:orotate phosphoribosyltransferase
VLIVEDVVTSGGQILLSAADLRQLGANIEHVVCVIDRQGGGAENLAEANLKLHPLYTMNELKEAGEN